MSKIAGVIEKGWKAITKSLRDFPLETLLGVTYFAVFILERGVREALGRSDIFYLFFWFFPQYVLLFTLHKLSGKHLVFRLLYCLSWFLWIPLLLWGAESQGWSLGIAYIIALILLILGQEPLDNESYGRHILDTALSVAKGFLIGFLLMGIVTAIIASISFLFNLNLDDNWFSHPNAFIAFNIIPLLCCAFVTNDKPRDNWRRISQIVIDYILSPALVIYAVILYVYIARIIIRWELPNGGVAYIVAGFMTVGLACHLFRLLVEKRHFGWFYKAFPVVAIAPLILLWIGIFRRVGEYGLTEPRVYLICLALLLTIFTAMLARERSRNFQLMTLIMAAALILITFIPGIRAKDLERISQRDRISDPDVTSTLPTLSKDITWIIDDIDEPIELGEYTLLVPSSNYHYYEDSERAVFYKDDSRSEELLSCEIREALDSPDNDTARKLVYKNENYLAVFNAIIDTKTDPSMSFTAAGVTLFRKP